MRRLRIGEPEVRYKIEQALTIAPVLTVGMLQAFLTSRISHSAREVVLKKMVSEGLVEMYDKSFRSYSGQYSTARMVRWVGDGGSS